MRNRYTPLAAAILSTLPLPGHADTADAGGTAEAPRQITITSTALGDEQSSYTPVTATVGSRLPAELKDTPQSVTVINEAVLDDQAATTLVEALRNVPGITISAGEGGNIGDNINLRGFSARTDLFLDGFRDRGQYSRDVFALDAVEVLKGPSSMLFGRGSTGGVINQVSKRPDLKDRSEISATVGTDDYYRATFDTNHKLSETAAVRLSAFWQDIGYDRNNVEKQDFGLAPSLRMGIGGDTEVTVSALLQRNNDVPDYGGPLLRPTDTVTPAKPVDIGNRFYGYSTDHFDQDIDSLSVAIRHKLNDTVTLRNRTSASRVTIDAAPTPLGTVTVVGTAAGPCKTQYGSVPLSSIPLSCLQAQRQDRDRDIVDTALSNQTDLIMKFGTGLLRHTVLTGLEVGRDSYDFERYYWNPANPVLPLETTTTGPHPGSAQLGQVTNTEAKSRAVYANEQLDVGQQWKVVAGVRYERFETETLNKTFAITPAPSALPARLSNNDDMLSTRAGLLFQPTPAQSYYVSYGTSFNPSAEAVTQSANNASLDPEKNRSWELGGKWTFADETVLLNAAVFRVEKQNARTTDPATSVVSLDGDVRVEGFETSITGQISPEWQVIGGYTYLDSEVLASKDRTTIALGGTDTVSGSISTIVGQPDVYVYSQGKDYQNTPRHNATLWTTFRLTPQWQVGAGASGASSRFVNNFETAEVDGYVRGDAMVAYLQPAWDLRLNVQNVTDKLYYETASSGRATAAMGRRTLLTGTWRF